MRLSGSDLILSASDLSRFLGCRHLTGLDLAATRGLRPRPRRVEDPLLEVLWKRGLEHEAAYVASLEATGHRVTDLRPFDSFDTQDEHVQATLEAMQRGDDVIVQAALRDDSWFGKPDVLRRVPGSSAFGNWSYEVIDTKLSRETKAGTILQLGLYSEMLGRVQQARPETFHVVTPDKVAPHQKYRLDDYAAYFRLIRTLMLDTIALDPDEILQSFYPEPVAQCEICSWAMQCRDKRRADDHLSLVAGITRIQRRELDTQGIRTLTALGGMVIDPFPFKPRRGSVESFIRTREQARLQVASRDREIPLFELREIVESHDEGLCRLPEPSPGDIFLDLEGDPFATEGGREYLFGLVTTGEDGSVQYRSFWGLTERDERVAFEAAMDVITAAWEKDPGMHVYHYAPYEPSAFKRLMGRHVTREHELDNLLRNGSFVDLYAVIRQGVRVGTERYSIKNLEPLYAFKRTVELADARRCLQAMEHALAMGTHEVIPDEVRNAIEEYNRDDCVSTLRLRDWLEQVRADHIAKGMDIPRPKPLEIEVATLSDRDQLVADLRARLLRDVLELRVERDEEQQARWLLAYLLDYHRREDRAVWHEYFRLRGLAEEALPDEPQAIAQMQFAERIDEKRHKTTGRPTGTVTDRYTFEPQEVEIEKGDLKLKDGTSLGKLVALDREAFTVDIQKGPKMAGTHPESVFAFTYVPSKVIEESILGIGTRVANEGKVTVGSKSADRLARALLLAKPPRLRKGSLEAKPGEGPLERLLRVAHELDHGVLAVQGPPGSGKTYSGAEMICSLVEAGKRVGIAATSHKVIRNLLEAVQKAAAEHRQDIALAHRCDEGEYDESDGIACLGSNMEVAAALASRSAHVAGGTAWVWSAAEVAGSVDVLFIDEAGQVSLANAVAMSPAAENIVLLGDPQQLEQPRKGSHPEGVAVSALQHMLGDHATIPDDRGVFLPTTWRMCPAITSFTSELFYENRLEPKDGLDRQVLSGAARFDGNGLWMIRADHDGNRTSSVEEIELVAGLIEELVGAGSKWMDDKGRAKQLTGRDILVVAPYNAQVSRLIERVRSTGARVGTVDKFQGQEAPVVIYSMATSRPEDAPRGMEFLYSLNRLNVATSRARCAAILVASRFLFEPECRSPHQMKLANALCRYREMAVAVGAIDGRGDVSAPASA
jgi:predicted RecB family nuclease